MSNKLRPVFSSRETWRDVKETVRRIQVIRRGASMSQIEVSANSAVSFDEILRKEEESLRTGSRQYGVKRKYRRGS